MVMEGALVWSSGYGALMMTAAFTISRIQCGFNNAVGHANAKNGQRVPESTHKHHVGHIPDPFKIKRKHTSSSLSRFKPRQEQVRPPVLCPVLHL